MLKLTSTDSDKPLWINPKLVASVFPTTAGGSCVSMANDSCFYVKEKPADIAHDVELAIYPA